MAENRGGPRVGTPGRAYPNRSDLAATTVPPSTQYGQGVQLERVRDAGRAAAAANPAPSMPLPEAPGPFHRPTDRPDEPITAGLSSGPGAGPDVLGLGGENAGDYARVARYLPVLELVASRPEASELARNFVRLVRGSIRPGEL